jgi:hypothetical protein
MPCHEKKESKAFEKKEHTLKKNQKLPKLTLKNNQKGKPKKLSGPKKFAMAFKQARKAANK